MQEMVKKILWGVDYCAEGEKRRNKLSEMRLLFFVYIKSHYISVYLK